MLFRCILLLFCITAIAAQKGSGRKAVVSESSPVRKAIALARKTAETSPIQQVQEPDSESAEDAVSGLRPTRPSDEGEPAEGHAAPEPYSFSYSVEDPESGAASSREETQDASGEIVGFYHITDKDGRSRRVEYTAGKDGFKATIKSNEEGLNSRSPADVKVELSASPSETVETYVTNNRPSASEASIKSYGKTSQSRPTKFYQRLLPPPPPPQEEQIQDTQVYESQNEPETTQQQYLEEDIQQIPYESGNPPPPQQQLPPPQQPQPTFERYEPPARPVVRYTPIWNQAHREQGSVNLQPVVIQPEVQYREDIPQHSYQEIQQTIEAPPPPPPPPAATKTIPSAPLPAPTPQQQTPVLILPPRQVYSVPAPPQPQQPVYVSPPPPPPPPPTPIKYIPQAFQNLQPLSPTVSNIIFGQQHREPISQQQLLQYFQPFNLQPLTIASSPQQPIVFDATPPRAIKLFSTHGNDGQNLMTYIPPKSSQQIADDQGIRVVVHREQQTYQLPPMSVPQGAQSIIPQRPRQEFIAQEQVKEEVPEQAQIYQSVPPPPPPPQPLPPPPPPTLARPIYRPLPTLPRRQVFEPQVYEPQSQQTYEPLQQSSEAPQKCDCNQPNAEQTQVSYGIKGAQSVTAPVKGRLSPSRNLNSFLPKAFRMRRDSTSAQSESSGVGSA